MSEGIILGIVGIVVGLIGWFLNKIYKSFEETKADVKQLLINGSARDEDLKSMEADIHTLILRHDGIDKRLQKVEQDVEIIKIKKQ